MFELMEDGYGNPILRWTDKRPDSGQRGLWVEIGRHDEDGIDDIIRINQENGLHVFMDERGIYRAFVLGE